jgi:imidazolonepropionase-like amidohydrolase
MFSKVRDHRRCRPLLDTYNLIFGIGRGCRMTTHTMIAGMALALALSAPREAAAACDSSPLVIRNANVWTPAGILIGRDVVFRDGRVAAVARAGSRRGDEARSIDGTGHTLLPGLIDAHLHLVLPGGLAKRDGAPNPADIAGRQLLRSGVTSGRVHLETIENGARLQARSTEPCAPMPRLQVGGPGLSGNSDSDRGNYQGAKTRDAAVSKVERFRAAGFGWVAIHDADKFPPDVLDAIRETARRTGVRLMASGGTAQEIAAALRLEPATLDYIDRTNETLYQTATLDLIRARRDLVLVPTPGVPYRTLAYAQNPDSLDRPEHVEFLDPVDRAFVLGSARKDLAGSPARWAERVMTSIPGKFRQLRELGLRMALGSDAGSPLHFPGGAIWWELEAWRSLGASHREALTAATENGARVLNADDIGHLRVGGRADFVLYRGHAELGPFASDRVLAVGKDGVLFVEKGKWTASTSTSNEKRDLR